MKNKMVGLELPSIMGMGISGPVLAFLTASLYSAFRGVFGWGDGAYACIMFVLSSILALLPSVKSNYSTLVKIAVWPIASVMIFASAWGSNTGMSLGEGALGEISGAMTMKAQAPMLMDEVSFEPAPPSSGSVASAPAPAGVPLEPENTVSSGSNVVVSRQVHNLGRHHLPDDIKYLEDPSVSHGRFFRRIGMGL